LPTKGPSNLYQVSERINFEYARGFIEKNINVHVERHGFNELKLTKKEYIDRSVKFANNIDKVNNQSFVDDIGSMYKRNKITKEFGVISNKGNIVTYFKMSDDKKWRKLSEKRSRSR
jgi:hypothetical protein